METFSSTFGENRALARLSLYLPFLVYRWNLLGHLWGFATQESTPNRHCQCDSSIVSL
ncbi:hypothetical protein GALMADRAFT_717984 [Galerina marginata CBS 339.88]|uniref:Uncharacterized protein n=1 Tax=Galerina marginata (strain CBS 339.88) TaxID=685588 RepID=A0A067TQI8_GALM3|nr:hypothetical protein GALMADRAFT_717984 [Galerina marginata CBS 339.88]